LFLDRGATPWSWTALCSKKNKVATPFHSNRMERRRHIAPFLRSHAANHASKEAEVATANTDRGRAPGLVSAFLVALTKRFRTARPAGRAPLLSAPSPTPHCDAFTHHVRQMSGHDVSVAAEKRARWKSAFMAAPTKLCSPSRPAWRAVSKKHEGRNLTFVPWKVGEAPPTTIIISNIMDSIISYCIVPDGKSEFILNIVNLVT
jgi:hypothetical protein